MVNLVSFGNKRDYEDFKKQIPTDVLPFFDRLRSYCLSLGKNVVEDVRMHRIVFGKSMAFRWFADLEPEKEGIIVKIQKGRKIPPQIILLKMGGNKQEIENLLKNAYNEI